jgi:hypothetical protein
MLARGNRTHAGFIVPVVGRTRAVAVDPAREKLSRIAGDALAKRDEADARVSATLESARSRLSLLAKLRDAHEQGETGAGFTRRFEGELKKAKAERLARAANPQALELLKARSDALDGEFQARALRTEAGTRARDRVVSIGKTIDDLVAATEANPSMFESHYTAGRDALERLNLPKKALAAFRDRLSEIPRAALRALAERQPAAAVEFTTRRKGPAHPKFRVSADVVRLIGKQAQARLDAAKRGREVADGVKATRTAVDLAADIDAYKRGETPALSMLGLKDLSATHGKRLRKEGEAARAERKRLEKAGATVRERLAAGKKLEPDHANDVDGVDVHYEAHARNRTVPADDDGASEADVAFTATAGILPKALAAKITALVRADEPARVVAGVKLIDALERVDAALTKRLDRHVLEEAHDVIELNKAGVEWTEAVRVVRAGIDLPARERERRAQTFEREADGKQIADAIAKALGVEVRGLRDDGAAKVSRV